VVHPHWGTFPPQHPLITDLFGVIFFLVPIKPKVANISNYKYLQLSHSTFLLLLLNEIW
jgi:hypothetical protein